jgi:hypothetical protein
MAEPIVDYILTFPAPGGNNGIGDLEAAAV